MFAKVNDVTYVAPPNDARAVKVLTLHRYQKLRGGYIALILVPGSIFLAVGVLAAYYIIGAARSWSTALAGVGVGILCVIGTLAMGRAGIAIARQSQLNQFNRFVNTKRILALPKTCSDMLYELLEQSERTRFLYHYRPDPYDLADLKKITEELESGSGSPAYIRDRLVPTLERLVGKIQQAQQAQEEADTQAAKALDELPRPDDFSGG